MYCYRKAEEARARGVIVNKIRKSNHAHESHVKLIPCEACGIPLEYRFSALIDAGLSLPIIAI